MATEIDQLNEWSGAQATAGTCSSSGPGVLDGVTIMRYAHMYRERASGGTEQYLRHLDGELLRRHRMTIVQMHLIGADGDETIETENVGMGRIVWVPVACRRRERTLMDLPGSIGYACARARRLCRRDEKGRSGGALLAVQSLVRHYGGHLWRKTAVMSDVLSRLLVTQKVDLLTVHWMTYDTTALISCAMKAEIPFVFINHFQNRRLLLPRTRRWITRAAGIGTVSKWGIPEELSGRTVNLSDAVDTQFFDPEKARPVDFGERRVVLMTARIAPGKGHADLIEAARILISRNLDLALCFVGAVDSECLYQELGRLAAVKGLRQRVFFLGERSQEEIRDWYALSSVVVLPSYAEGLPRVVLEAQAMKRPVVAYDCGGPSEAMLPNETGFLVTPGDVAGLAERIGFLLGNEAERLRMGERGRAFVVGQFGLSALVERHEALYCKVLSGDSLAIRAQRGVKTARLE